jgi:SRSO17 transposase
VGSWYVATPKVYPTDVTMIFPTEKAPKPRKHHIPDMSPVSAETMLVGEKWQKISWRWGTKGPLTCLFAARRVRIADGPKHRVFNKGVERMPGDEVWILGERRSSGERRYYISNLPADVSLKTLAAAVKARWICEQAHQSGPLPLG